jgi:hypothetical protein
MTPTLAGIAQVTKPWTRRRVPAVIALGIVVVVPRLAARPLGDRLVNEHVQV